MKERATTFSLAIVGQEMTIERTDTKHEAKKIKSDNFIKSNREKSNFAIENNLIPTLLLFCIFEGINNILVNCK